MKRILINTFFLAYLIFISCTHTEKVSKNFKEAIKFSNGSLNRNLENRVYQHCEEDDYHIPIEYKKGIPVKYCDTPFLCRPLSFFKDGVILNMSGVYFDSCGSPQFNSSSNFFYQEGGWGVYKVINDSIQAIMYLTFMSGSFVPNMQLLECNFEGLIKNNDTILQWHLIPPYPKVDKRLPGNITYVEYLKKPIDLYYKNVPVEKIIDPSKAWINKYKTK